MDYSHGNGAVLPNRRDYDAIDGTASSSRRPMMVYLLSAATLMTAILLAIPLFHSPAANDTLPLLQKSRDSSENVKMVLPTPASRCDWVMSAFAERDGNATEELADTYKAQSTDFNVFYRATAHIFWYDFVGAWGDYPRAVLEDLESVHLEHHLPLSEKSTWTWVTGDQHLSNFGAWRNRHKDVVFGVNDFDEAAVFDFHIDVLRIAVSICNHALANNFDHDTDTHKILKAFTTSYVETIEGYVGNENAMLFELTPETTYGKLHHELKQMAKKNSISKQLGKFTYIDPTNTTERSFLKGPADAHHKTTRLAAVDPATEAQIRAAFTATHYGATRMQLGWNVREWDDAFFRVLDVAERVGSGVGSFGVSRYYVLLNGADSLLEDDDEGHAIILDVKLEPIGAVERVLDANDRAWYNHLFQNPADRVAQGQRRLTSYTDPFTGWVTIDGQVFGVRQRSPWKDSIDLDELLDVDDFEDFVAQIAIATATSHVRGSPAKPPADFKHVIHSIMKSKVNRREWGQGVENFARAYHEQVLLDYECFANFVQEKYGNTTDA